MDDQRFAELCRRIHRRGGQVSKDAEYLLDVLEVFDTVRPSTPDEIARQHASALWSEPKRWGQLIEESRTDSLAWDTLKVLLRRLLEAHRAGAPTPQPIDSLTSLQLWGLEAFVDLLPRPGRKGGDSRKLVDRNEVIVLVADRLRGHDIPVVYDGARSNVETGCGMVASRLSCGEDHVRKIWKNNKGEAKQPGAEARWRLIEGLVQGVAGCVVKAEEMSEHFGFKVRAGFLDMVHSGLHGRPRSQK